MGTIASRHGYQILENTRRVIAIEAIIASQAVEIKGVEQLSPKTREQYEALRKIVPSIQEDRPFHQDIENVAKYLKNLAYQK